MSYKFLEEIKEGKKQELVGSHGLLEALLRAGEDE